MKYQLEIYYDKCKNKKNRELRNRDRVQVTRKNGRTYKQCFDHTTEHKVSNDLSYLVKMLDIILQKVKRMKTIYELSWTISEDYKPILRGEYVRENRNKEQDKDIQKDIDN